LAQDEVPAHVAEGLKKALPHFHTNLASDLAFINLQDILSSFTPPFLSDFFSMAFGSLMLT
jgi:hypothetical protein